MFKITGLIKKVVTKEFTRRDGTQGSGREVYLEPTGSLYPVKINIQDMDFKIGKEGETVTLDVEIFPYYYQDKKRKKAFADYYIPNKK